jgi:hypothetical protein
MELSRLKLVCRVDKKADFSTKSSSADVVAIYQTVASTCTILSIVMPAQAGIQGKEGMDNGLPV